MESIDCLAMINRFDEATKANLNKILYKNEERSDASINGGNCPFSGARPFVSRDLNPICDDIYNIRAPNF